jgi:PAS domain S-box-containing protein
VDLPSWREFTGQSEEAIKGWGWIEAVHPDDRERASQAWIKAVEAKSPYENEFRVRKYDGSYPLFLARAIPVLEEDGSIREWVGTCADITERKRMEEQYRSIVRTALDGFWIADTQGRFLDVNDAYCNLVGYSRGELLTMGIPDVEAVEKLGETGARIRKIMEIGGDRFETLHRCKDGRIVDIEVSVNCMKAEERLFVFLRDITGRKRAEAELKKHREHLAELVEERTAKLKRTNEALETEITERKKAEEEVRESEERFRLAINATKDGLWEWDIQTNQEFFSPRWCEIVGYSFDDPELPHTYKSWASRIHPDDYDRVVSAMTNHLERGTRYDVDYRHRHKSGEYRWQNSKGQAVLGESGKPIKMVGCISDITERKQAEETLRETRDYLENLFNYANAPIIVWDPQFRITRFNHAFESLTGREAVDVLGKSLDILFPPTLVGSSMDLVKKTPGGERWKVVEIPILHLDGSVRTVLWNSATVFAPDGQTPVATIAQGQDITERKRAEEALKESEARFRAIFEGANDGILIADGETKRFVAQNQSMIRMLGYTSDELTTIGIRDIHPEADLPRSIQLFEDLVQKKIEIAPDVPVQRKDGSVFYADISTSFITLENRLCLAGMFRDITARKQAEEKLKLTLADLERSNKELEQFAYVASHDLQEPLRTISSSTQLLARRYQGQLDADADEFIAYAVNGANRMQRLINDLLSYSRVGTRGKGFEPTDCTAVLDQTLANLKAAIEESGAVVTHNPLPTVMADKLQLVQLFENLIGNAIKFHGEEPPRVHVSAEQKGNEWVFSVRDNGIGIDPQYAERIFVIFQRLHTIEEYPGTGIGLAICKKIVECHGGRIWVESQPGIGSTFYFTIPIGGNGL